MPISIAAPPQRVPVFGGFDYVAVDPARHRMYAAHTRSSRLLVVDTANGSIAGQVDVGTVQGVAVDPATGAVFTGNGTSRTISKVDPVALKVLAKIDVPGTVDTIAYDAPRGRLYADQDRGPAVYVIDGASMKMIGTIVMPDDDLESLAVDPATGILYQNLVNGGGFAMVDPATLHVTRVVKTPQLERNHPAVFSPAAGQLVVGGVNGLLSAYTPEGTHIGDVAVQPRIDQCATGAQGLRLVCAGRGIVTVLALRRGAAPTVTARIDTGHPGIHTVGLDEATGDVWVVWSDVAGDWVQRLVVTGD